MSIDDYFEAQRANLNSARRFEPYALLMPKIDALYRYAFGITPSDKSPVYAQFLLICHKSFLSAAALIGQAQPDDANPITRRAIEAVRVAAAIRTDPAFAKKWTAWEERTKRWKEREEGRKPKPPPKPRIIVHETVQPIISELMTSYDILSDTSVHFSPEYFSELNWERRDESIHLNYFEGDQRVIEREIINLIGIHLRLLEVIDWCLDGAFTRDEKFCTLVEDIKQTGKPFAEAFDRTSD